METKEILERLKEVANKSVKELTAEDKAFVSRMAEQYGVRIARKSCNSCYVDAAVEVYGKLQANEEPTVEDEREYVLKPNTAVIYNGIHVNNATMTDEKAKALLKAGLPANLFSKLPANEDSAE